MLVFHENELLKFGDNHQSNMIAYVAAKATDFEKFVLVNNTYKNVFINNEDCQHLLNELVRLACEVSQNRTESNEPQLTSDNNTDVKKKKSKGNVLS